MSRCLVVGGGLVGLAAAYHLARAGTKPVILLEQFRLGHVRGSSHGAHRISRSSYADPRYARLMRTANALDWPRLVRDAGRPLVTPHPGCFFGPPGGLYADYVRGAAALPDEIVPLDPAEASRRFPQFRFDGMGGALWDRTAGIIDARGTIDSLAVLCVRHGVEIREDARVRHVDLSADPLRVDTDRGSVETDLLVVAAGAWASALFPFLADRLTVLRQTVGYFRITRPERLPLEDYPVWCYLGGDENDFYYGLPDPGRGALKAARHVTRGAADDPQTMAAPSSEALHDLERFLGERLTAPPGERRDSETCLYTMTATEDFILDHHPQDRRVVIGSACSGHGFKFGPLSGRILAELVLNGRTSIEEFEENRAQFSIRR